MLKKSFWFQIILLDSSDLAEKMFKAVRKLRDEQGMAVSEDQAFAQVAEEFNTTTRTASRHYYDYKNYRDELIQDMVNHAIDNLGDRLTTAEGRDEFEKFTEKKKVALRQKFIEEQVPGYRETLERLL